MQELRGFLREAKKNENAKQLVEDELKKKVRVMEKMMESKCGGDIGAERKRLLFEL